VTLKASIEVRRLRHPNGVTSLRNIRIAPACAWSCVCV
jgi:hypothetical protein